MIYNLYVVGFWTEGGLGIMSRRSVSSFDFSLKKLLKRSCNFSREKSNELTDQQDMFYYRHRVKYMCDQGWDY